MDRLVTLSISIGEKINATKFIEDLTEKLILYSSGFTYSLPLEAKQLEIGFGYSVHGDNVVKDIYLWANIKDDKGKKGHGGIDVYIKGLKYLSEINLHSHLATNIIRCISVIPEAYKPSFITVAHHSLKKLYDVILYDSVYKELTRYTYSNRLSIELDNILATISHECTARLFTSHIIPLTLIALSSGVHRYGLALRQIAFQTIVYYLCNLIKSKISSTTKEYIISYLLTLLSNIVADTYIWLPYTWSRKVGAYGSEYVYAIAASPLAQLIDSLYSLKPGETLDLMLELIPYIKHRFIDMISRYLSTLTISYKLFIQELIEVIRESINKYINVSLGGESLIGRARLLLNRVSEYVNSNSIMIELNRCIVLITATEQFNPLIVDIVLKSIPRRDHVEPELWIIYTPQTFYQLLLYKQIGCMKKLMDISNEKYIIIPATEGWLIKHMAKDIAYKLNNKLAFALLQGSLMTTLPIYHVLSKERERVLLI